MKKYIVEITPLTAIHIGTGEEFGPLEYTIKDNIYFRFKEDEIIKSLTEDEFKKLDKLIENEKLKDIASFFSDYIDEKSCLYQSVVPDYIRENFNKNKNSYNNQLLVSETYRNKESYLPSIPGSSIKGAIRTAIISKISEKIIENSLKKFSGNKGSYNNIDSKILKYKDAKSDPFRAIHITDSILIGKNIDMVTKISNVKSSGDEISKNSIQIMMEVIKGELLNGDTKGFFELDIDDELQKSSRQEKWEPLKEKFTLKEIIESCNHFYKKNFEEEKEKFYQSKDEMKDISKQLKNIIDLIDEEKTECLIRVGHFSQIENVTIDKHRKPKTKDNKFGNTRMLLKDYNIGLGWIKLKFYDYNENLDIKNSYLDNYNNYLNSIVVKKENYLKDIDNKKIVAREKLEEEKRLAQEQKLERKRKLEEEKRLAQEKEEERKRKIEEEKRLVEEKKLKQEQELKEKLSDIRNVLNDIIMVNYDYEKLNKKVKFYKKENSITENDKLEIKKIIDYLREKNIRRPRKNKKIKELIILFGKDF